jgi:putative ABC transport system permease protein
MLVGDRVKYLGMIVGVVVASFLMNQQLAIFWGLTSQSYGFIDDTAYPDLWVMDKQVRVVDDPKPLSDTALYRVRSIKGVAWAVPMYRGLIRARLDDGTYETCVVVGLDDATLIGGPPVMLEGELGNLRRAEGVIIDNQRGKGKLSVRNPDGSRRRLDVGDWIELNDHRAMVVGISENSPTMQDQPTVYTTYSRAIEFAPRERRLLTFILVGIEDGADRKAIAARIDEATGLAAHTQEQFAGMTFNYIMQETGIPINFAISTTLGFFVGAAIVALLFYMFTSDNLRTLGALKAMGTSNWTLMRMTLLQAALVGAVGYSLGVGLAAGMGFASAGGELAFRLVWWIPAVTGTSVLVICLGSAATAIVQVFRLEPAIVFKG